jgi:hypothetical protein
MTKLDQNFEYWTGTDKTIQYGITDSTGASQSVTSFTCEWRLFDEPNSSSLLRLKTSGSGITTSTSVVDVVLAASLTAGCNLSGTYYHELSACDSSGNADILAVGYARIHKKG